MNEKKMRHRVIEMLVSLGAFPVENQVGVGMPDVACTLGWIELKVGDRPMREDTNLKLGIRPAQRVWHRQWRAKGGRSWTLSYVRSSGVKTGLWMLHDGAWSADCMDLVPESVMVARAVGTAIDLTGPTLTRWLMMPTIYSKD